MEELRKLYIEYQSQFYSDDMYSQIDQSDQNRSILAGGYDEIILRDFKVIDGKLTKNKI